MQTFIPKFSECAQFLSSDFPLYKQICIDEDDICQHPSPKKQHTEEIADK